MIKERVISLTALVLVITIGFLVPKAADVTLKALANSSPGLLQPWVQREAQILLNSEGVATAVALVKHRNPFRVALEKIEGA